MFVLLFVFVFGGAISASVPGGNYVNFLMPGIFVQTAVFGATATGVGLAEDLGRGMIDRFRSLPMARSAVLAGTHLRRPDPERLRRPADDGRRRPRRLRAARAAGCRPTC